MTTGADLKRMICLERLTCERMMFHGKLATRKLAKWKEGCFQDLKEGWKTARKALINGFARLVLWDQEMSRRVEVSMSKDQDAMLKRLIKGLL